VKFCNALAKNKEKEKEKERTEYTYQTKKPAAKVEKKPENTFAALYQSSDDEEVSNNTDDEYPTLGKATNTERNVKTCWAAIAAKPKEEVERTLVVATDYVSNANIKKEKSISIPPITIPTTPVAKKNWADWSESEDEDDELSQLSYLEKHSYIEEYDEVW
jgi:hypothetical protein